MTLLDIAEVARRSRLPASTLRYYEEKGLVRSVGRRGLKRLFTPDIMQRLALIKLGRNAGFSLNDIRGMFGADGRLRINRAKLSAKADDVDRAIGELTALRDSLRHAAVCPAPSHMECPTFQKLLRVADGTGKRAASKGKHAQRLAAKNPPVRAG